MTLDITVIVCTFNNSHLLKRCLHSLVKQKFSFSQYEIVVVDNNSTDNTRSIVDEFQKTDEATIRYIFERRQGLSIARNRGIQESKGQYVAFTDDDATADSHWLVSLYKAFTRSDPHPDVVGGKILPIAESPIPLWYPERAYSMLGALDLGPKEHLLHENELIFGGNMAFRKTLFDEAGLFNEQLGLKGAKKCWSEDTEFIRRLLSLNKKVYYTPHAIIHHFVPARKLTLSYLMKRNFSQGKTDAYLECTKKPDHILKARFINIIEALIYLFPRIIYRFIKKRNKSNVEILRIYFYRLGYQLKVLHTKFSHKA